MVWSPRADAGHHLGSVVETTVADDVPEAADGAGLVVVRREHDALDPGQHGRARAHGARLERHHERAALQPPLTPLRRRDPQRDDLGVAGGVVRRLPHVVARAEHPAVGIEDDGAHRHVAGRERCPRLVEREPHRVAPTGDGGVGHPRLRPG